MNTSNKIVVIVTLGVFNTEAVLADGGATLNHEHKAYAIESLRTYEESLKTGEIKPPVQPSAKQAAPFECVDEHEQSCKTQEWVHNDSIAASAPEPTMYSDGKYKVTITFAREESLPALPILYHGKNKFESTTEAEHETLKNKVFEEHLGLNYWAYDPELVSANSTAAKINIWIRTSDELQRFADDPTIQGMFHINNSQVTEGYSNDGYETLKVNY